MRLTAHLFGSAVTPPDMIRHIDRLDVILIACTVQPDRYKPAHLQLSCCGCNPRNGRAAAALSINALGDTP